MTGLADTHCHLSLDQFAAELDSVLGRAREEGVEHVVVPGIDLASSQRAVEIAETKPGVYAAVGIHPHNAASYAESARDELLRLAEHPKVVAIGEIGLDFYRDLAPRDRQVEALLGQLALAKEMDLPVIIHNREAQGELFEVLLEWAPTVAGPFKGVLHAFSGDQTSAEIAVSSGFFVGVAGPITYPSAEALRRTIAEVPTDRLLLETDSPYLPPQPHRGRRNEPAYLPIIAEELSKSAGKTLEEVVEHTSRNAGALFGWLNGS